MTLPSFPTLPGMMFPVTRRPVWSSSRQETVSGRRSAYPRRNIPRWQYEVSFDLIRDTATLPELQSLAGLFNQCQGGIGTFSYQDPDDCTATNQVIGTGDGSTTTFQLVRSWGGISEPVYLPVGAITVKVAGTTQSSGYTVNSRGQVVFTTPPSTGQAVTWTGVFSWVCRFDDDQMDLTKFNGRMWELKNLKFSTEII